MRQINVNSTDSILGVIGVKSVPPSARKTYLGGIVRKVRKTTDLHNVAVIGVEDDSALDLTFISKPSLTVNHKNSVPWIGPL